MSGNEFMTALTKMDNPNPEGNVFSGIWSSYERVVLHSLITSFGLDFLVQDQHGGDVDTIRGVRDLFYGSWHGILLCIKYRQLHILLVSGYIASPYRDEFQMNILSRFRPVFMARIDGDLKGERNVHGGLATAAHDIQNFDFVFGHIETSRV